MFTFIIVTGKIQYFRSIKKKWHDNTLLNPGVKITCILGLSFFFFLLPYYYPVALTTTHWIPDILIMDLLLQADTKPGISKLYITAKLMTLVYFNLENKTTKMNQAMLLTLR